MRTLRRRPDERVELLQDTELFSACSRTEIRRIGSLTMFMDIERDTVLVEEDRVGREFFVVVKGTATATRQGLWLANSAPEPSSGNWPCSMAGNEPRPSSPTLTCLCSCSPGRSSGPLAEWHRRWPARWPSS